MQIKDFLSPELTSCGDIITLMVNYWRWKVTHCWTKFSTPVQWTGYSGGVNSCSFHKANGQMSIWNTWGCHLSFVSFFLWNTPTSFAPATSRFGSTCYQDPRDSSDITPLLGLGCWESGSVMIKSHVIKSVERYKCKITDRKRIVETSIASTSGFKVGNINMKRFKILKEKKELSDNQVELCFNVDGGWERWLRIQYRKLQRRTALARRCLLASQRLQAGEYMERNSSSNPSYLLCVLANK